MNPDTTWIVDAGFNMNLSYWMGTVKDGSATVAAVTATVVAIKGLRTWKKQIRGNADFDVAKRTLHAVYDLREAIMACRDPFMSAGELADALEAAEQDNPGPERVFATPADYKDAASRAAYQRRWKRVADAEVRARAPALEGEALWGPDVRKALLEVSRLCVALHAGLEQYVSRRETRLDAESFSQVTETIWEIDRTTPNPFTAKLAASIDAVEQLLAPHLKP
jgi:hypothetical protein